MSRESVRGSAQAKLLRAAGLLLVLLGVVHLAATPHIPPLLKRLPAANYQMVVGPMVLNHVLVGFLLLPLGYATWFASDARNIAQPWARRILLVNSLTVLTLPAALVGCMRQPVYYTSPLFLAGAVLVAGISLLMLAAAISLQRSASGGAEPPPRQ